MMRLLLTPLLFFVAMFTFVFARGVILGSTSAEQVPLYLINKSLALAAVGLLGLSLITGPLLWRREAALAHSLHPRHLGRAALAMVVGHAVMSMVLMGPSYYSKFYQPSGKMTWEAELSLLASIAAFVVLLWQSNLSQRIEMAPQSVPNGPPRNLGLVVVILAALHVFFMGYTGWFDFSRWQLGFLPPSTFVGFALACLGVLGYAIVRGQQAIRRDR